MDLALFDFDGTITRRDTMPDFMHASVRPVRLALGKIVLLPLLLGYKVGLVSGSVIRAAICLFGFWRIPVTELERRGAEFAESVLPKVLRPEAMQRIAWHKARGDTVVVVSGGLDLYLSHWAKAHGVGLLCSSLQRKAGRFSGRYRGAQCVGAEKARRVQTAFPLEGFGKTFAYGDTREDYELLALAHEAYYRWRLMAPASSGGR